MDNSKEILSHRLKVMRETNEPQNQDEFELSEEKKFIWINYKEPFPILENT